MYDDRIEIDLRRQNTLLTTPYAKMLNIENVDENKIAAERVVMFGIIGALWKKRHTYTMIEYKDEMDEQKIILDLEDLINIFQPFIYRKKLENRKK